MRNLRDRVQGPPSQPVPRRDAASTLAYLLERPRFEVLPTPDVIDRVGEHLPPGRTVTVTASQARGLDATVHVTEELAAAGYHAVPHLAARMITDTSELSETVTRLQAAGVTQIFIPSGDATEPGSFPDAMSLLRALDDLGRPFGSVGVTAYPESHPTISDDQIVQAMWDKRHHATELVSNLAFDAHVVEGWLARVRARGITLPLWLGVPGAVSSTRLLRLATNIGVGDSARYVMKHPGAVARLLRPGESAVDTFLRRLAPALARPESGIAGLHVFTFNQVAETEEWRAAFVARLQEGGVLLR